MIGPDAQAADAAEDPGPERVSLADHQRVPVDLARLMQVAERALSLLRVDPEAALDIALVSPDDMAALKEQALGVRAATDVLAFPLDDPDDPAPGPVVLGQVVLCPAVALRQARALALSLEEELTRLLVHGILHLLGRDHADARTELTMAAEQQRVVRALEAV